jgi:hypothetical protein
MKVIRTSKPWQYKQEKAKTAEYTDRCTNSPPGSNAFVKSQRPKSLPVQATGTKSNPGAKPICMLFDASGRGIYKEKENAGRSHALLFGVRKVRR